MISPANAQTFSSSYTSAAAKDCRAKVTGGDGGMRICADWDAAREDVSIVL
jgi:hypothetical protein